MAREKSEYENLDAGGELKYEHVALADDRRVFLKLHRHNGTDWDWVVDTESPHISRFAYEVCIDTSAGAEAARMKNVGTIDGYIISSDGQDEAVDLWDEADALDGDVEAYVTCLKLELQAVDVVSDFAPQVEWFTRILIVRHFQAAEGVDSIDMIVRAVAAVAMKEGPTLLMVDPREMPEIRKASSGKLKGRSHTAALMRQLGMVRMISCRFVWGWHVQHDTMTTEYSYEALVKAKAEGRLDEILEGLQPDVE